MNQSRSTFQQIVASWLSLKLWVKIWLFYLNAIFLAAFAFLDDPAARWILLAYIASGPLLAYFMIRQRGLTRLLGVAHLVPWTPLVAYLVVRIVDGAATPASTETSTLLEPYLYLLLASIVACLAFDIWDVARYLRGDRFVLGSPQAVFTGASNPSPVRLPCESPA